MVDKFIFLGVLITNDGVEIRSYEEGWQWGYIPWEVKTYIQIGALD